jgi:hypothetical protein
LRKRIFTWSRYRPRPAPDLERIPRESIGDREASFVSG